MFKNTDRVITGSASVQRTLEYYGYFTVIKNLNHSFSAPSIRFMMIYMSYTFTGHLKRNVHNNLSYLGKYFPQEEELEELEHISQQFDYYEAGPSLEQQCINPYFGGETFFFIDSFIEKVLLKIRIRVIMLSRIFTNT